MVLTSHGDLAAAEVAFYSLSFCLSIFVCFRQGFAKNLGWFYLVTISILRIIGASSTLYIATHNDASTSVYETAIITSSIGTAPLILVLLGFLERINQRMYQKGIGLSVFRPIHLLSLAAFILAIVGGVKKSHESSYMTGKACLEAASIIFLVNFLALAVAAVLTATRSTHIPPSEQKLSMAAIVVLPFVLVRVIYTIAVSFSDPGSVFYPLTENVWVQAFMMFCVEAISVSIYIWAGVLSPRQTPLKDHASTTDGNVELGGYVPEEGHQKEAIQEKSIGDYRPSRLIRNALRSR